MAAAKGGGVADAANPRKVEPSFEFVTNIFCEQNRGFPEGTIRRSNSGREPGGRSVTDSFATYQEALFRRGHIGGSASPNRTNNCRKQRLRNCSYE